MKIESLNLEHDSSYNAAARVVGRDPESAPVRVVGVGAGGHARVVLDIIGMLGGMQVIGLIDRDDRLWNSEIGGVPVLGGDSLLPGLLGKGIAAAFIGVAGAIPERRRIYESVRKTGFEIVSVIHPGAWVSGIVRKGRGATIMAGVVVNTGVVLGENVILNSGAVVEHDCLVEDHVHIAPGAVLAGTVTVREQAFIGAGAVIRQGISIGARATVGAGAVVVKDVPPDTTVGGCPAHPL